MSYAQARLRLGIAAVGTIVVLSAVLFVYQLPSTIFPFYGGPWYADWAALIVFYLGYALVSMPFDLAGGYWLPCRHNRICLPLPVFLWKWVRGVAVQGCFMTLAGLAILESAKLAGYWGAVAAVAIIQFLLLLFQTRIALLVGGLAPSSSADAQKSGALALDSLDPGFSGGFAGLPGLERLILPGHWLRALSPEALDVELKRRAGLLATGTRLRGVLLASAWNLAGFMLCGALPWVDLATIFGLLEAVLGCALWSFLGLLILPSLSRPGVLEADRWAIDHGATHSSLLLAMTEIDRFQEDEPSRSRWIERIFHPIPSIENRLKALESPRRPTGAWQAARMALYLSWANFGLLSRAVHCNSGRPDLWVIPPGD
ncbi:MAG: hypothetical protein HXY18_05045 [Bryobacteraceae bacterium]|nr:hypothetical protein [Bryobacteraceae bacterium]